MGAKFYKVAEDCISIVVKIDGKYKESVSNVGEHTSISIYNLNMSEWDIEDTYVEITKAQYNRLKKLALAKINKSF